jgi:drug/metabolite transporter (DMT)-like permease
MGRSLRGVLWVACGAALWGTDTLFRRPLTGVLGPTQIVLYEHLILTLLVLPIIIANRSYLGKIQTRVWGALIATAWIGSALSTVLFTAAIRSGNPTTAVLLQKTQPFFAIALARFVLKERWPSRFPFLALMAITGAYLVAFGNGNLAAPAHSIELRPALLAFGAAAGWGCATIWGRIATADTPFEVVTALRFAFALPPLFLAALIQGQTSLPSLAQSSNLLWVALVPGFAGLLLYYRGLRQTPASQASIAELAFPVTASLINWYAFGADLAPLQIAGFAIVWAAIFSM